MITITNQNKQFIVYSPLTTKSIEEFTKQETANDGERILLEGIASTSNKDLQGDIIAPEAIKSMAQQAPGLNIHGDHHYGLDDVIGAIQKSEVQDGNLHIQFLVTKRHTPIIQDMLDTGVNLGLSIGGFVEDYDYTHNEQIKNIKLAEISLTPMPANWDTYGTVQSKGIVKSTCLTGACHEIMKNIKVKTMNETENETETEQQNEQVLTKDDAVNFFNELMAAKEQSIVENVTNTVKTEVTGLITKAINEALEEAQPDTKSEPESDTKSESNKEEDDVKVEEDKEPDTEETDDEEKTKAVTEYIDSKFTELEKRLFKNMEETKPESHVKKALKTEDTITDETGKCVAIETIAKKLASKNDKQAMIKQLQQ